MIKAKFISVNQLLNQFPKIVKELKEGCCYTVTRYSKPVSVLLNFSDYEKLFEKDAKQIKECKKCLLKFKREIGQ